MRVRFVGGPLDGRTEEVSGDLAADSSIYWPPGADLTVQDDRVPGVDNVVEYLSRRRHSGLRRGPARGRVSIALQPLL